MKDHIVGRQTTNSGKWGIPEKSYKNVAQQCYLDGWDTLFNMMIIVSSAASPKHDQFEQNKKIEQLA